MSLHAFRKNTPHAVAHLFDDDARSLCGLTLGLESEWPATTFFEHSSCQKCAKKRDALRREGRS